MKKVLITMCILLSLLLAGCSDKSDSDETTNQNATKAQETTAASEGFGYEINGTFVVPGTLVASNLDLLGEPVDYMESDSCYFDGLDKIYYYDGFKIVTYPDSDANDYVQDLCIESDKYSTKEGITVGSSLDDVVAAYGSDYKAAGKMYKYYSNDKQYTYFFIINDAVKYFGYATDI